MTAISFRWLSAGLGFLAILAAGPASSFSEIMINNGLAPPNASNVFAAPVGQRFIVRNQNCTSNRAGDPCAAPGASTAISIDGSNSGQLYVTDTSSAEVSNGYLTELAVYSGASITLNAMNIDAVSISGTMSGGVGTQYFNAGSGAVLDGGASALFAMSLNDVFSSNFSFYAEGLDMGGASDVTSPSFGGSEYRLSDTAILRSEGEIRGGQTYLQDSSILIVRGENFTIDGAPVGLGAVSVTNGNLLGTSAQGATILLGFVQGGGLGHDIQGNQVPFTGTLILVPEPGTGMLTLLGLLAVAMRKRG